MATADDDNDGFWVYVCGCCTNDSNTQMRWFSREEEGNCLLFFYHDFLS